MRNSDPAVDASVTPSSPTGGDAADDHTAMDAPAIDSSATGTGADSAQQSDAGGPPDAGSDRASDAMASGPDVQVPVGDGGTAADIAAAAVLNRYQILDPCDLTSYKATSTPGAVCPQLLAVRNQHVTLKFGGDPTVVYSVTMRVRGVFERYWYAGGQLDPVSKVFYTGGVPTIGGYASACKNMTSTLPFSLPPEITPTDNCFNGFNVAAMLVSQPKQHYYLNYTTDRDIDRPPHAVYTSDYTVTIMVQGMANIDFYVIGSDDHECYNTATVIPGVSVTPSPYVGDFLQFDVLNVTH